MIPIVGDAAGAAKIGKNLSKISDLPKQLEQNIYRKTTTGASRKLLTPEQINELRQREIRKLEFEASKRCLRNTCFPSGTLVYTKDGKIPIEQIEAGMMVYAQNIETGEIGYQEVLSVSQASVRKLFHIYLGDIEIQSTAMHQMYVYEKGFVTAQDLLVGDQLVYMNDGKQKQIPIDNITVQFYKIPVTVHNFKVNKWHTYMVGELGFLVHNGERKCTLKTRDKEDSVSKKLTTKDGRVVTIQTPIKRASAQSAQVILRFRLKFKPKPKDKDKQKNNKKLAKNSLPKYKLSPAGQRQKKIIDDVESLKIVLKSNKQKGNYGEMKMDVFFESVGCKRISKDRVESLDDKIKQGIDGVYEYKNPPPKYIIGEAKYNTSRLGTLLDGTKQMSNKWIFEQGRLEKAVGKRVADEIRDELMDNPDNISKQVFHVYPGGKIFFRIL